MNREEAVFYEAMERTTPAAAAAFLDQACAGDDGLRQRVERLLAAHRGSDSLIDAPLRVAVATHDMAPAVSERPGDQIGPYKLLQEIGTGGFGVVYMADQVTPVRRRVALKIIKPGMDSREVIARFEAERQALAMMDHPNIAKIFDAGMTEGARARGWGLEEQASESLSHPPALAPSPSPSSGRPYFVMELVKGVPITQYCDDNNLATEERLKLFTQVCHAVQHAHQKGVIHRDLKPSNVMVTLHDGLPVPKVIDFGVSKALNQQLTEKTLFTHYGQMIGTPLYMSPEQAEMSGLDVDTRSDVYSLGVLLYELLTGTTPFDKDRLKSASFDEMRRIIREEEPETVSARIARTRRVGSAHHRLSTDAQDADSGGHSPPYASPAPSPSPQPSRLSELDWIAMKSLEKDRSRRYESASSLAADIQRYLSDEPVLACPPTTMYRFQKFARKHKPALATAAALAACLLLGTTISAWQALRATAAEAQATANEAEAQASAQKAAEKAQEATTQRDEAQKQRDEVKALADQLAAKEQQLERTLYAAHLNLAKSAWDAGGIGRVNELLEKHRPKPGETDLRGFEWHYLYKLSHPELLTLKGHIGDVWSVAFSPDGKRLASASKDKTVKVWDAQTGQELLTFKGHTGVVWSVVFSPEGKRLASASDEAKVWDVQTGHELISLKVGARSVAFSPDGKRLASGSQGGIVKVWDAQTGHELLSLKGGATSVVFSPDGKRVASAGGEDVKVWDAQTGQELLTIKGAHYEVVSVAFSQDGKRLASGGAFGAKVWDAQSGQELLPLTATLASKAPLAIQVTSVALSPDGKRVATTLGFDHAVKLWDTQTGEELLSFIGHSGWVSTVTFNPEGTRLASAGGDGTVRVWDTSTGQQARKFSESAGRVSSVSFSPDGKRLATGSGISRSEPVPAEVKVWDAQTGQELLALKGEAGERVLRVTLSPDGKRLAAGMGRWDETNVASASGYVKVWDAQTGQELLTFKGHTAPVIGVAFSPDSTRVVSSSGQLRISNSNPGEPNEVKVWDASNGEDLLTLKGHKRSVNGVAYCPDGKRLATLSRDNTLKVWDAQTGQELLSWPVTGGGSLAFSPDGNRIASSNKPLNTHPGEAGEIKLWNAQSGEELFTLQGHTGVVTSVVFSPDGKRLASGAGREMKVWDAQTGEELITFANIGSGGVAFSPDGHPLASAGAEGLKIFDATPLPEELPAKEKAL